MLKLNRKGFSRTCIGSTSLAILSCISCHDLTSIEQSSIGQFSPTGEVDMAKETGGRQPSQPQVYHHCFKTAGWICTEHTATPELPVPREEGDENRLS